jgi:hypothetical protein
VSWLASSARATSGHAGGSPAADTAFRFQLPASTVAAGIVVQNGPGGTVTALAPQVTTIEDGTVALDGRMQSAVTPPHWTFTGTVGSFGVFRNASPRGWAWTTPKSPGGRSGQVRQLSAGINGTQRFLVRAQNPVWLVRSEAPAPGWHATVQRADATGTGSGPTTSAPVVSSGVTQQVELPAGDFVVTFHYAPVSALVGIGLSVVGGLTLAVGGAVALVGWRRRRRTRSSPRRAQPVRTG